jgi:hypothetical protein
VTQISDFASFNPRVTAGKENLGLIFPSRQHPGIVKVLFWRHGAALVRVRQRMNQSLKGVEVEDYNYKNIDLLVERCV